MRHHCHFGSETGDHPVFFIQRKKSIKHLRKEAGWLETRIYGWALKPEMIGAGFYDDNLFVCP